ncbi:MAG TPA: S9 family peptidase [Thermoanaerobaculia bacterium]|jgi:dipeptidyl aminopeptidase/acylaminoacyl peptidase|nr:S9 family peptidase [Thermoanaerobaculia bacterium]
MPSILHYRRAAAVLLVLLALVAPHSLPAADKRPIAETDLFKFVWTADPRISPDGKQVVYVRVTVNEKKEGYDTALWTVFADGSEPARPFTSGPHDSSPRWSPDGTRIAFVRIPEKEKEKEGPQIYLISTRGGEAVALTSLPKGAAGAVWSPDGKTIAFESTANDKDLKKWRTQKEKEAKDAKDKEKSAKDEKGEKGDDDRESDVRVVTKAIYRFNGGGYADPAHPAHLWTIAVLADGDKPQEPKQLTSGARSEGEAAWSPDGSLLYFGSDLSKESYYEDPKITLFVVPAAGGEARQVVSFNGGGGDYSLSPDGRWIALTGFANPDKPRSHNESDLFVIGANSSGEARNLTASYDGEIGEGIGSDQHPPRGGSPKPLVWSRDGRSLYVITTEQGRANLSRIDVATGTIHPVTHGDQEVVSYSASADGSRMALVLSTTTVLGDLYSLDTASGKLTPIARPNQELFSHLTLTPPEEITYKSFDGKEIHAFVQKPADFDAKKKYPLILNIHGGPHSAYGYTFFHEMQWMAAKGYVVIYPNPRGSSTYGQDFGNIIQYEFPGDDAKDLLAGVDEMVKRGIADPKRLGVTGGSGGGILTNWIVTQTDRFAAAAAQRSIASWADFWYTADFTLFRPSWFRGAPWEDPQDFARRSPITYAVKITTPLMLIEGEADYRTPPSAGGEQMFRALKYMKKPVVMVRFPGESHELSRSGQPWHRIERLRHIMAWMDKYLQGKKTAAYDVR